MADTKVITIKAEKTDSKYITYSEVHLKINAFELVKQMYIAMGQDVSTMPNEEEFIASWNAEQGIGVMFNQAFVSMWQNDYQGYLSKCKTILDGVEKTQYTYPSFTAITSDSSTGAYYTYPYVDLTLRINSSYSEMSTIAKSFEFFIPLTMTTPGVEDNTTIDFEVNFTYTSEVSKSYIKFTRYKYDKDNNVIYFYTDINEDLTYYVGTSTQTSDGKYSDIEVRKYAMKVDSDKYALESDLEELAETLMKNYDDLESAKQDKGNYATLDENGKVPSSQLPSYVDDVLEFTSKNSFPSTGESDKIYIDKNANIIYRWSGTQYVEISSSLALGETSSTAYAGDKGKALATKVDNLSSSKQDKLTSGSITTSLIKDSAITTSKLTDGSVSTSKVADKSITKGKLDDALVVELNAKLELEEVPSGSGGLLEYSSGNSVRDSGYSVDDIIKLIDGKVSPSDLSSYALKSDLNNFVSSDNTLQTGAIVVAKDQGSVETSDYSIDDIATMKTDIESLKSTSSNLVERNGDFQTGELIVAENQGVVKGSGLDLSNVATKVELNNKQATLVSGTNIKTINGESLLGSGNITISTSLTGSVGDIITVPGIGVQAIDDTSEENNIAIWLYDPTKLFFRYENINNEYIELSQYENGKTLQDLLNELKRTHNILIQGIANNFPFALSFNVDSTDETALTSDTLKTLLTSKNLQVNCSGYYISFNTQVINFGVNGLNYYSNSAVSNVSLDDIISGITNITDTVSSI